MYASIDSKLCNLCSCGVNVKSLFVPLEGKTVFVFVKTSLIALAVASIFFSISGRRWHIKQLCRQAKPKHRACSQPKQRAVRSQRQR